MSNNQRLAEAVAQLNQQSAIDRGETPAEQAKDAPELNNDTTSDTSDQEATDEPDELGESSAIDPEGSDDDDELDLSGEDEESQPTDKLEAPKVWKAEDREAFASLDRKGQELMLKIVSEKDKWVDSKVNEAAAERKAFAEQTQALGNYTSQLESLLRIKHAELQGNYPPDIDWATWYQTDFVAATQFKARQDADVQAFQQSVAQLNAAKAQEKALFVNQQTQVLNQMMEEDPSLKKLHDPEVARRLAAYADKKGFTPQEIDAAGARQVVAVYHEMLFSEAKAKAAEKAKQLTASKTPNKNVPKMNSGGAVTSGMSTVSPQMRDAQKAFDKNPSQGNLLALMNAQAAEKRRS